MHDIPAEAHDSAVQTAYSTQFLVDEAPLSEGGRWINGRQVGRDWTDVRVFQGRACAFQVPPTNVADNTALLAGKWAPDQTVIVTAYNELSGTHQSPEMEIRLRSTLAPNVCTGYEVCYCPLSGDAAYLGIIRWNGPYDDYEIIEQHYGSQYVVRTGDKLKGVIQGNVISAFINDRLLLQVTDDVFGEGCPGIGFDQAGGDDDMSSWGFTSFSVQASMRTVP